MHYINFSPSVEVPCVATKLTAKMTTAACRHWTKVNFIPLATQGTQRQTDQEVIYTYYIATYGADVLRVDEYL